LSKYTSDAAFTLGPGPVNFASTLTARAPGDINVTVTNNIISADAPYDCTGRFVYLAGELFTSTPTVAVGSPVTLTSVLQPAIFGAAAATGTISVLEGSTIVASAAINGRVTSITVPSVSTGTHTYIGSYSGDTNYAQLYYGSVTVTTAGGGGADFAISATPSSRTVTAGTGTSYAATVTPSGGFTGSVSFSVSGLPSGATGTFSPTSVAGSGSSTLSVTTSSTTPAGSYPLTMTGTSGSLVHSATGTLVVNPVGGAAAIFSISALPSSQTISQGNSASFIVTITPTGGFTGSVSFTASGVPPGMTASFSPSTVAGSGSTTLTLTGDNAATGTFTLTITGTSGALSHSSTVTLTIVS
jgi:hypothetical protein